ncbi:MAG: hypothetical protein AAF921_22435 [Cyanobacteria bacterium P01_D01_bin.44]
MNIYKAYDLCIHSEIPLLETMASSGPADVTVRIGKLNDVIPANLDCGHRLLGQMSGSGRFLIRSGREIIIDPQPEATASVLCANILGPAMAVILRQRGLLVLHASAVVINNYAIAFMGGSGWGKSTLANAFHQKGYDILTDDVLAIDVRNNPPLVHPAFPQQKLWSEAAVALGHHASDLSPLHNKTPKLAYVFKSGFCQVLAPLQRIYVLAKGEQHEIVKLTPQSAFAELVRHTRGVSSLISPEFVTQHLNQCTQLIQTTEFCRFTRKPSLDALPELMAMVEAETLPPSSVTHPAAVID